MSRLRLSPSDERALVDGARALGVALDDRALASFTTFAALLETWSAKTNLISCATPAELVARHFLDSLALAPLIAGCRRVVDLGSGAGFPGLPLAIADPGLEVLLVEPRRRRANFLRTVKREIAASGVSVREGRAEAGPEGEPFGAVVCRAVWSDASALGIAARWLATGGQFLWMREGDAATSAVASAGGRNLDLDRTETYKIGGSPAREVQIYRLRP